MRTPNQWLHAGRVIKSDAEPTFDAFGQRVFHKSQTRAVVSVNKFEDAVHELLSSCGFLFCDHDAKGLYFRIPRENRAVAKRLFNFYGLRFSKYIENQIIIAVS